jgi:hypothetical protein
LSSAADGKRSLQKSRLGAAATGAAAGSTGQLGLGLDACFGSSSSSSNSSSSCTSLEFSWDLADADEPTPGHPAAASSGAADQATNDQAFSNVAGAWRGPALGSSSSLGVVVGLPGSSASCSSTSLSSMRTASPKPASEPHASLLHPPAAAADKAGWPVPAAAAAVGGHASGGASAGRARDRTPAVTSCSLGCSPSNWRSKGAVLLGAAAAAKTYWEFEALLVLLGGHWPARGLLSGCWPPEELTATADTTLPPSPPPPPQRPGREAAAAAGTQQYTPVQGDATEPVTAAAAAGTEQDNPVQGDAATEPVAPAAATAAGASVRQRSSKQQRSKRYDYAYVIHCNSIRQIARVVHMREMREEQQQEPPNSAVNSSGSSSSSSCLASCKAADESSPGYTATVGQQQAQLQHCAGLSASIQAAAALLQGQIGSDGGSGGGAESGSNSGDRTRATRGSSSSRHGRGRGRLAPGDLGTVVAVRFRFTHRPEWMQVGARMIVRDRSDGRVAAAGFVTALLDLHKQKQLCVNAYC